MSLTVSSDVVLCVEMDLFFFFFFFKQKTAYEIYQCDWSSDVCSSDLVAVKFHNDGADTFSLRILFADGKEIKGESIFFEPGNRVLETVTEKEILTQHENLKAPAR